jgi:hypothetical protein
MLGRGPVVKRQRPECTVRSIARSLDIIGDWPRLFEIMTMERQVTAASPWSTGPLSRALADQWTFASALKRCLRSVSVSPPVTFFSIDRHAASIGFCSARPASVSQSRTRRLSRPSRRGG